MDIRNHSGTTPLSEKVDLIGQIVPGKTISTSTTSLVDHSSWFTSLSRTYWRESRNETLAWIETVLVDGVMAEDIRPDQIERALLGLENLKKTYKNDFYTIAEISRLISKIDTSLKKNRPFLRQARSAGPASCNVNESDSFPSYSLFSDQQTGDQSAGYRFDQACHAVRSYQSGYHYLPETDLSPDPTWPVLHRPDGPPYASYADPHRHCYESPDLTGLATLDTLMSRSVESSCSDTFGSDCYSDPFYDSESTNSDSTETDSEVETMASSPQDLIFPPDIPEPISSDLLDKLEEVAKQIAWEDQILEETELPAFLEDNGEEVLKKIADFPAQSDQPPERSDTTIDRLWNEFFSHDFCHSEIGDSRSDECSEDSDGDPAFGSHEDGLVPWVFCYLKSVIR